MKICLHETSNHNTGNDRTSKAHFAAASQMFNYLYKLVTFSFQGYDEDLQYKEALREMLLPAKSSNSYCRKNKFLFIFPGCHSLLSINQKRQPVMPSEVSGYPLQDRYINHPNAASVLGGQGYLKGYTLSKSDHSILKRKSDICCLIRAKIAYTTLGRNKNLFFYITFLESLLCSMSLIMVPMQMLSSCPRPRNCTVRP